jgi:hypothetical protein
MTREEELESRSMPEVRICRNCKHLADDHDGWMICWHSECRCRNYEPLEADDVLQDEGKI